VAAVEIPYATKDGDAYFHAAGRRSHITELLPNSASSIEARELVRHKDVRMTMRYTHIGLKDQAKAIENLPTDPSWQARVPATEKSQHIRSKSGVFEGNPCRQKTPVVTQKAKARLTQVFARIHLLAAVGKKRHRRLRRCL
jgi:hypothetical protein